MECYVFVMVGRRPHHIYFGPPTPNLPPLVTPPPPPRPARPALRADPKLLDIVPPTLQAQAFSAGVGLLASLPQWPGKINAVDTPVGCPLP